MISPYSHEKAQEEAIAEALSELMASGRMPAKPLIAPS
jgi:hypothetical protein